MSARRGSYLSGRRTQWTEADVDAAVTAWSGALGLGYNRKAADLSLKVWCMEHFRHPVFIEVLKAARARLVVVLAEAPAKRPVAPKPLKAAEAPARKRRAEDENLSPICCVVDQFCTRPANLWGVDNMPVLRTVCARCGQSVCRKCSSLRLYFGMWRQRLCNDCQTEVDGDDSAVMARLRAMVEPRDRMAREKPSPRG